MFVCFYLFDKSCKFVKKNLQLLQQVIFLLPKFLIAFAANQRVPEEAFQTKYISGVPIITPQNATANVRESKTKNKGAREYNKMDTCTLYKCSHETFIEVLLVFPEFIQTGIMYSVPFKRHITSVNIRYLMIFCLSIPCK